jgi:hypothetical protein
MQSKFWKGIVSLGLALGLSLVSAQQTLASNSGASDNNSVQGTWLSR